VVVLPTVNTVTIPSEEGNSEDLDLSVDRVVREFSFSFTRLLWWFDGEVRINADDPCHLLDRGLDSLTFYLYLLLETLVPVPSQISPPPTREACLPLAMRSRTLSSLLRKQSCLSESLVNMSLTCVNGSLIHPFIAEYVRQTTVKQLTNQRHPLRLGDEEEFCEYVLKVIKGTPHVPMQVILPVLVYISRVEVRESLKHNASNGKNPLILTLAGALAVTSKVRLTPTSDHRKCSDY
jgi:hypothetical protein